VNAKTSEEQAKTLETRASTTTVNKAVNDYLRHINTTAPRGRKSDLPDIEAKIKLAERFDQKLILIEQLHQARERNNWTEIGDGLRVLFVEHAEAFGTRNCISYSSWREIGVPAETLRQSGISS
jgi:hypothetical protein